MPSYRKIQVEYEAVYGKAQKDHQQFEAGVTAGANKMSTAVDGSAAKMSASMSSAAKKMQNDMDQLSFRAIMVGQSLSTFVTAPIIGMGVAAVHANMEMDSMTRGLNVVMGSSAAAAREMERLQEVAKLPGLGLKEAYQGSLNLQAVGQSAKQARETLMAFGNALGTVGKGKNELAAVQEQVMQILSKGKVMTEDIRIIRNYVPQISKAMKDAFGTANAEEIAKMGVSGEEFVDKIVKQLAKLPKMTGGIKNELENVQDAMWKSFSKLGDDIAPAVTETAHAVSSLVTEFNKLPNVMRYAVESGLGLAALSGPAILLAGQWQQLRLATVLLKEKLAEKALITAADTVATQANTAAEAENIITTRTLGEVKALLATEEELAAAAMTKETAAATVAATASKGLGASLMGIGKALVPIAAVTFAVTALADSAEAIRDAFSDASNGVTSSIDEMEKRLESFRSNLDKKYSMNALAHGSGVQSLLEDIRKEQRSFDKVGQELTPWLDRDRRIQEGVKAARVIPGAGQFFGWSVNYLDRGGQTKIKDLQKQQDEAFARLNAAKDKLKDAGYDLAGNKLAKSAAENTLASYEKQVYDFEMSAAKAEQLGNEAGANWAKINENYYKKLADNAKTAASDKSFNKKAADALALEEFRADKIKHNLKQAADKQEQVHAETIAALEAQAAVAKLHGDQLAAAMSTAKKTLEEATYKANEVDPNTGKRKNSNKLIASLMTAAKATYNADVKEAIKQAKEETKRKAQDALTDWQTLTAAVIQGRKIAAEAAGKTFDAMTIGSEQDYVDAWSRAESARIEGKSPDLVRQLLKNASDKAAADQRKIQEEIAKANRVDVYAGIDLGAARAESAAKSMQSQLDSETNLESRLSIVTKIADSQEFSTAQRAMKDLIETQDRLVEVAASGVDITNQWDLALQKYTDSTREAYEASKKLIDEEVKHHADAVQQKVMDIRRENEEQQKAFLNEMERRKSLTRFTNPDDQWKAATISGLNEKWRMMEFIPQQANNGPATSGEIVYALNRVIEELQQSKRGQEEVKRAIESMGGRGVLGR